MHRHIHFCGICLQLVGFIRFQIVYGHYLQAVVGAVDGRLDIGAELLLEVGDVAAETATTKRFSRMIGTSELASRINIVMNQRNT